MKEKREALEQLNKEILNLTKKCTKVIPQDTEDSRVANQVLTKLSALVNDIHLNTFKEEEL